MSIIVGGANSHGGGAVGMGGAAGLTSNSQHILSLAQHQKANVLGSAQKSGPSLSRVINQTVSVRAQQAPKADAGAVRSVLTGQALSGLRENYSAIHEFAQDQLSKCLSSPITFHIVTSLFCSACVQPKSLAKSSWRTRSGLVRSRRKFCCIGLRSQMPTARQCKGGAAKATPGPRVSSATSRTSQGTVQGAPTILRHAVVPMMPRGNSRSCQGTARGQHCRSLPAGASAWRRTATGPCSRIDSALTTSPGA